MRPDSFQIMYFNIHQISSQMRFGKPKMLLTGFILWTIFTLKLSGSSHHDAAAVYFIIQIIKTVEVRRTQENIKWKLTTMVLNKKIIIIANWLKLCWWPWWPISVCNLVWAVVPKHCTFGISSLSDTPNSGLVVSTNELMIWIRFD